MFYTVCNTVLVDLIGVQKMAQAKSFSSLSIGCAVLTTLPLAGNSQTKALTSLLYITILTRDTVSIKNYLSMKPIKFMAHCVPTQNFTLNSNLYVSYSS